MTYTHLEIVLAFVDISSCFQLPRIFADLVGAFGFAIETVYFAANAMVFSSIASASSWDPFRVAIGAIATALFFRKELVVKHWELLNMIQWDESPPASITFVPARACSKYRGILDENGARQPTPQNIYVYDDLMADLRDSME